MSSPIQTPPPLVPLRPRRRSFAGPVVLIVLGVVFLLGNLHMISWMRLGTLFAHYWPALLILWGVIKLVEYQQASPSAASAREAFFWSSSSLSAGSSPPRPSVSTGAKSATT